MYAIIVTGGKQFRVSEGDVIRCEKIKGVNPGDTVEFGEVLAVVKDGDAEVPAGGVAGAKVVGEVVQDAKGKKIAVYKLRKRKGYRRKTGHRQDYLDVKIKQILLPSTN